MTPPFVAVLGDEFGALAPSIRALHGATGLRRWEGRVTVSGARGPVAWAMGAVGIAPRPMREAPFAIEIEPDGEGEIWRRDFDGTHAASRVVVRGGLLHERVGFVTFALSAAPRGRGLDLASSGFWLAGLRLPGGYVPRGRVALGEDARGRYLFDVAALAPSGQVALRYEGWLMPA